MKYRTYNVTIEYFGKKKTDKYPDSVICLGRDGSFLVLDASGDGIRFEAARCRVDQISANAIFISGFTDKPQYITAYCIYADNALSNNIEKGKVQAQSNTRGKL
jgi:hypothetical protein